MARTDDIATAFLAAHGTRFLASGEAIPWARMRRMFPTDHALADGFRFWRGAERAPFEAWLDPDSEERLYVVDPVRLVPRLREESTTLVLVVRRRGGPFDLHRLTLAFTPRTNLTGADVISFVAGASQRALFETQLLKWHDANLRWTAEPGWDAFARAATERNDPRLLDDVGRVLANVAFSEELRRVWRDFMQASRNPDFGPMFDIRHVESRDELALHTDRKEARDRLARALEDIAAFAEAEKLGGWSTYFRSALRVLDGSEALEWVTRDFAGLEPEALTLLAAAWKADAFGGSGSWNDVVATDMARYGDVSHSLFASLRPAVEAAING
jgi:hypothetical protein